MRLRTSVAALLIAALVPINSAGPLSATDPFYERLLESGILAFDQGDYPNAAADLRLACFGLLDEPVELGECLAYLALAQAEIGDESAFSETVGRLLEVEKRFQGLSQLDLGTETRAALEAHVERLIPVEVLEREPFFSGVARRKRLALIQEMPPVERRSELERLIAAEPDNQTWRLWLAELALSSGDFQAAFDAASELLAREPELPVARCLRGRAGAASNRCRQAVLDLAACETPGQVNALLEVQLRCAVELADWDGADALMAQLTADELRVAPFKQLARSVRRGKKAAARQAAAAAETPQESSPDAAPVAPPSALPDSASMAAEPALPTGEPMAAAGVPEATAADEGAPGMADSASAEVPAELARIRERLSQATVRDELDAALADARRIADENPLLVEAQLVTGSIAYRMSRWQDAVTYFGRVDLTAGEPEHQFYYAVALYEAGNRAAAEEMLERCLPLLERTSFVESYTAKILD